MTYRVIRYFTDLQDGDHPYNVGDKFPRDGIEVSPERLAELSGPDNLQRTPLIEAVKTRSKKKNAKRTVQGTA